MDLANILMHDEQLRPLKVVKSVNGISCGEWVLYKLRCICCLHCFLHGGILGLRRMVFQQRTKGTTGWRLRNLRDFCMRLSRLRC